jgi:hypothetical protein
MPCGLIGVHPHFKEICCFHLQGREKLNYNMNRDNTSSFSKPKEDTHIHPAEMDEDPC